MARRRKAVEVWAEGREALSSDPVLGPWIEHVGPILWEPEEADPFYYLTRSICYQQLAGAAAATIHGRVVEALDGNVAPRSVLAAPDADLRAAGLSRNKLKAIRDLAEKVETGDVCLADLGEQSDEEVVARLTRVWGVGEWTAQMYLMFRLWRPDVWPVLDLGVRSGYAKAHGLDPAPTAKELDGLGDAYRPWRSVAAYYCWRVLETELP